MKNPAVAADNDVLRRDAEMEGVGQPAIVDDDLHRQPERLAITPDRVCRLVESGVHRDHLDLVAQRALDVLEVWHLQAARHAPSGPELQVDRFASIELGQVDLPAIQGGERDGRRELADQRRARGLGQLLGGRILALGLGLCAQRRARRRPGTGKGDQRQQHHQGPGPHFSPPHPFGGSLPNPWRLFESQPGDKPGRHLSMSSGRRQVPRPSQILVHALQADVVGRPRVGRGEKPVIRARDLHEPA